MTNATIPLWRHEFPAHFDVPESLTNDPEIIDMSYGNDVCPSFTTHALADYNAEHPTDDASFDLRLWVETPDSELRECGVEARRFAVHDGCNTLLFDSETDLDGAIAMLKRVSAEILAHRYHPKNYPQQAKAALVTPLVMCPACRLNVTVPANGFYNHSHDKGRGGFQITCDGCQQPFVIERDTVLDLQCLCHVLLGEA